MFEAICKDKLAPLMLRLALGLICVTHGYLKIMATGGTNWQPGMAVGWQLVIAWAEFTAGVFILVGFHCRPAAVVVVVLMGLALLLLGAGELAVGRGGGRAAKKR